MVSQFHWVTESFLNSKLKVKRLTVEENSSSFQSNDQEELDYDETLTDEVVIKPPDPEPSNNCDVTSQVRVFVGICMQLMIYVDKVSIFHAEVPFFYICLAFISSVSKCDFCSSMNKNQLQSLGIKYTIMVLESSNIVHGANEIFLTCLVRLLAMMLASFLLK